jgi:hypothetical protein
MTVIIVWNPTGFYRIVALPKGMKSNAGYYSSHTLDPLAEWRKSQVGGSDRRLHVHARNAYPHTAKKGTEFLAGKGMKRAPRASYSRDLAPCDFYPFDTSKTGWQVHHSRNSINFCKRLMRFFSPLKKHIGTSVSGMDGQIGAMLCGSWWFNRRYVKKFEDDPSFTEPVSGC